MLQPNKKTTTNNDKIIPEASSVKLLLHREQNISLVNFTRELVTSAKIKLYEVDSLE